MKTIDWLIITVPLIGLLFVALHTRSYLKGVADFLSGGRMAGRYLLAVAKGEQGVDAFDNGMVVDHQNLDDVESSLEKPR